MNYLALRMLTGDRAKYLGIVMGLTFASLLITQQASIYTGLMTRSYSHIDDTPQPDIWVTDPEVEFIEDLKRMLDRELFRVRGVDGVEWAVPLYKGYLNVRLPDGKVQIASVIGLDDSTLIGAPPHMAEGNLEDLRKADAVIVDAAEASKKLSRRGPHPGQDGAPLSIGDGIEVNDHRAQVVGLCRITPSFYWQPTMYTTFTRAVKWADANRRSLSYVLVKARLGIDHQDLCRRITEQTGLLAQTKSQFSRSTMDFIDSRTGISVNFGLAILLGFVVGAAVAGQTFYNFTLDNLRHFGALKAMGAGNTLLLRMILVQALVVGALGYGLGVGAATIFGWIVASTQLAFRMTGQLLFASSAAIIIICALSAAVAMRRVMRLEPAIVFKG